MALIIEDGSLVVGANSYVTIAEAIQYATQRREPFPTDEGEVEALLHDAMDYIEAQRRKFAGKKVSSLQGTQFPRVGCIVDGTEFPSTAIPNELKLAQCQLAVDSYNVGGLTPSATGYAVSKEKVDIIEVHYAAGSTMSGGSSPAEPAFPKADSLLEPLYGDFGYLRVTRT